MKTGVLLLFLLCLSPAAAPAEEAPVVHVVLVWLKEPGNAAHREALITATRDMTAIPGVVGVRAGAPLPSTRAVVDASFDVGLYMAFESERALEAYLVHPLHQRSVNEVLRPLASRSVVYDFIDAVE